MSALFQNYARRSIHITEGKGTVVKDENGKSYLDFTSGIAVVSLGHAHPSIVKTLQVQSEKLWHISNLFESPAQEKLAETLTADTPLDCAFFCNSGAEANEAAIKLARKATGKHVIVTFEQSFHGRTTGAMAATGQDKVKQGFGPLMPEFRTVPFNDTEALKHAVKEDTAAIMLEVIQGEGGVNVIQESFARDIQELCDSMGVLLIIDEVQTGIGRTGTRYAFEQTPLVPDIVTLAKGLGGGFPIGSMLGTERLSTHFGPGTHGTTFGGNPLAVAVAQTVVDHVFDAVFLQEVKEKERVLREQLAPLLDLPEVKGLTGKGLMLGVVLHDEAAPIVQQAEENGLLLVPAGPNVIRMLPPLTVTEQELKEAAAILKQTILGHSKVKS
ncbi:acetylornithine transaminase [Jeotgalibacillus aurantiacus]|uniref:acetylornithine transaminase n=1 Tax=Jeotgalibacillus aurantiacus TaxID=2763266 RepID=UPI001D0B4FB2|nr:acetylornithine transaminase [Jeotgalibacillus aurantiacus]